MGFGIFKKIKEAFKKAAQWVKDKVIKPFMFLGKYSLEIYLVHVAISKIIVIYGYPNYTFGYYFLFMFQQVREWKAKEKKSPEPSLIQGGFFITV